MSDDRGRRMVVRFTTTYVICVYHHWCCEFDSRSGRSVQHHVIKFVIDLRQVGGFLRVLRFPPPIKPSQTMSDGCTYFIYTSLHWPYWEADDTAEDILCISQIGGFFSIGYYQFGANGFTSSHGNSPTPTFNTTVQVNLNQTQNKSIIISNLNKTSQPIKPIL